LRDPELVSDVDTLLMESTYGDRVHPDVTTIDDRLGKIIEDTMKRKGRVLIPTFALERAQEVLFTLWRLQQKGRLQGIPIYLDSPLAISITEIYKLHPESLDPEISDLMLEKRSPFSPEGLHYVESADDSKALQASGEPCIIMAGAGMCEGGRILFHFLEGLGEPRNSVVIVGFMAQHTLGRRLVDGVTDVKVFGVLREVHAQVHSLQGLSAHADRNDLLRFACDIHERGNLRRLALVHGEPEPRETLARKIEGKLGGLDVVRAARGEKMPLR
jgi:metallo-beta-lactamase family protein